MELLQHHGTPPITTPIIDSIGFFVPKMTRFTLDEVKREMWCGDGTKAFVNLFNLFGRKFAENFNTLIATPILEVTGICNVPTETFEICATTFLETIRTIGKNITPEIFLEEESKYLGLAITTIPPIEVPLKGFGLIPTGTFIGTATVIFE